MSEKVSVQRDYAAPPERVFEAWTRVELLQRWLGCGADMLWTIHEWDVRVGGAIHASLEFEDGPFEARGEFLEVEPPRRLRYRWSGDGIVEVTIEPHGSGSRVRIEHTGLGSGEELRAVNGGWAKSLAQLDGALTRG